MKNARSQAGAELIAHTVRTLGCAQFRVHGSSMRPWLRSGDLLLVRAEPLSRIRPGEVVVFARAGGLFAHRVIGKSRRDGKPVLITKGDAFPEPDAPVCGEELLGRVAQVVRGPAGSRRIRLDSVGHRALGKALARVSASSRWWYPGARALKRLLVSTARGA